MWKKKCHSFGKHLPKKLHETRNAGFYKMAWAWVLGQINDNAKGCHTTNPAVCSPPLPLYSIHHPFLSWGLQASTGHARFTPGLAHSLLVQVGSLPRIYSRKRETTLPFVVPWKRVLHLFMAFPFVTLVLLSQTRNTLREKCFPLYKVLDNFTS